MAKISVIIPFYNQNSEFLKQALDSSLSQSIEDIEVICIDDGSEKDDCFKLVLKLKEKDKRIKLYKKQHTGAGESRNMGIKNSTGENIMFLDSDDYYPNSDVLEKLYKLKTENKVLIAGGKHLIKNDIELQEPYFNYGDINHFFSNRIVRYTDFQFPWWYWCYIFDANLIKNNNIIFPPYIRYQDPPFFVRVMNKAEYFYAADFISYIHRNSNKLFSMSHKMANDHVKGISDILKYAKENNLTKLYSFIYETFFNYDVEQILKKAKDITEDDLNIMKKIIKES